MGQCWSFARKKHEINIAVYHRGTIRYLHTPVKDLAAFWIWLTEMFKIESLAPPLVDKSMNLSWTSPLPPLPARLVFQDGQMQREFSFQLWDTS